jgi:hypothetical protein
MTNLDHDTRHQQSETEDINILASAFGQELLSITELRHSVGSTYLHRPSESGSIVEMRLFAGEDRPGDDNPAVLLDPFNIPADLQSSEKNSMLFFDPTQHCLDGIKHWVDKMVERQQSLLNTVYKGSQVNTDLPFSVSPVIRTLQYDCARAREDLETMTEKIDEVTYHR